MKNNLDFSLLSDVLPPLIWRCRWDKLAEKYGLPYRRGYLQNLDSEDRGPRKVIFNRRIAYKREDLIQWLNAQNVKRGS